MKNNKFSNIIEYIGLDYKKEIIKLVLIPIVGTVCFLTMFLCNFEMIISLIPFCFSLGFEYYLYTTYQTRKRALDEAHKEEFISIINYFKTFIQNNNNVYQSFRLLMNYSSDWMRAQIKLMLDRIDFDKSIKPFIEFADSMNLLVARNVMLSIYQMIDQGETEKQLTQFTFVFEQLRQNSIEEKKEKKEKSFGLTTIFPLVGSALMMISLSICILESLGDLTNVI